MKGKKRTLNQTIDYIFKKHGIVNQQVNNEIKKLLELAFQDLIKRKFAEMDRIFQDKVIDQSIIEDDNAVS